MAAAGGGTTCALVSGKLRRSGVAWSLFIAGSFDVDAAIITLSGLPKDAVVPLIGAFAIGSMVAFNMAFKMAVAGVTARRLSLASVAALGVSLGVLLATLG